MGTKSSRSGRSADNLVIEVPPGTIVYNDETAELIGDLVEANQSLVVAKGGQGGRGNQHFATSRNQMPLTAERGEPGEELTMKARLRLDCGCWLGRAAKCRKICPPGCYNQCHT